MNTARGRLPAPLTWLRIDPESTVPPFDQVRGSIAEAVRTGDVPVGTKLPPVRELAAGLGVAVNTVARAYKELERAGVVETRSRAGTIVADAGDEGRRRLADAAAALADIARDRGFRDDEALDVLRAALAARRG